MKWILGFLFCFFSVKAFAASGGGHEATIWTYAFPFINFFLLVGILYFFLRKSVRSGFQSRSKNVKDGIEEAKTYYDQALRKFEEIECKLKNSDVEGKKLLDSLKASAEAEKRQMITQAEDFSVQLKNDTQNMIQQEVTKAQNAFRSQVVGLATQIAETTLKDSLTKEDQGHMNTEFVQQVKTMAKGLNS